MADESTYTTGFLLVDDEDQPLSLIGFRNNIDKRQELIEYLCHEIKNNINQQLDNYCDELRSCTQDTRSYYDLTWAYLYGGVPVSEEQILKMAANDEEISQQAVDSLVESFEKRCSSKIPPLENAIIALAALNTEDTVVIDRTKYNKILDDIKETDKLIKRHLNNSATWKAVIAIE
jgi:hypothetical protein